MNNCRATIVKEDTILREILHWSYYNGGRYYIDQRDADEDDVVVDEYMYCMQEDRDCECYCDCDYDCYCDCDHDCDCDCKCDLDCDCDCKCDCDCECDRDC